ncbi:MAG: hypothetical protein ACTHMM_11950 [Agriterribacter sp.]
MNTILKHAKRELDIVIANGLLEQEEFAVGPYIEDILSIAEKFGVLEKDDPIRPTATNLTHLLRSLLLQEPITSLMGTDDEWVNVGSIANGSVLWQNIRCASVFRHDGIAYNLYAVLWRRPDNSVYYGDVVGMKSRQNIRSFPFFPKTFIVDVTPDPEDTEYYMHGDDITRPADMDEVFEYYDRYNPFGELDVWPGIRAAAQQDSGILRKIN